MWALPSVPRPEAPGGDARGSGTFFQPLSTWTLQLARLGPLCPLTSQPYPLSSSPSGSVTSTPGLLEEELCPGNPIGGITDPRGLRMEVGVTGAGQVHTGWIFLGFPNLG